MSSVSENIESVIVRNVCAILTSTKQNRIPDIPKDYIQTDSIGEVLEKLIILHIRTWMLEDAITSAKDDHEVASLKKKIDICFKQKRPMLVQAINSLIDNSVREGKSLVEDSVKHYK